MKVCINGQIADIDEASTISDAVRALGISDPRGVAVAVDGDVVPAARWEEEVLTEGRKIEILRAVQGGAR